MTIKVREEGAVCIIDIEGNIDINSSEIVEAVGTLIRDDKIKIVLNFKNVGMVDYSGLSVLAIAFKNVANHNGKMKFLNVPPPVVELFKMVRLDIIFEVYSDEEAVLKSFIGTASVDEMHLRRRFKRLDIHLKAQYRLVQYSRDAKTFEGYLLNLSAAGMFLYTHDSFPINTRLNLELMIPGSSKPIKLDGRVIWHADKELQPHSYPGMGIAFNRLTTSVEKQIVRFVDKNIGLRAGPEEG